MFKDKVLLITGGTGSFGNAVIQKFLDKGLKEIRVFSRDEKKQEDMRIHYSSKILKFIIGDVRDFDSIKRAMKDVDFVFHAAALKQVPSCEFFPIEALRTNVLGTNNVLEAAIQSKVKRVICLSTDKAAYPVNAMGITKALMEKVAHSFTLNNTNGNTIICVTRYGNVMASRGSVIPLFIEQIKSGKDITVTNPHMTRFLMSLDEAVDLVVLAFEKSSSGDLFVQKAPSCYIGDLAIALIKMFNTDTKIINIGPRHAEKLYETLLTNEEFEKAIDIGDFYKVNLDSRDLNYQLIGNNNMNSHNDSLRSYNSHNTQILSVDEIIQKLISIEYVKNELDNFTKRGVKNE